MENILLEDVEQLDLLGLGFDISLDMYNETDEEKNFDSLFAKGKCPICDSNVSKLDTGWFCMHCLTEYNNGGKALEPIF